jgi:hypothetical protein
MRLWPSCCPGEASETASSWWVSNNGTVPKTQWDSGSARSKGHPAQILAGRTFEECPACPVGTSYRPAARCIFTYTPHNSRTKPRGLIASFRIRQPDLDPFFLAMQTLSLSKITTRRARDSGSVMRHKVASIEDRRKGEAPFGTKTAHDRTTRLLDANESGERMMEMELAKRLHRKENSKQTKTVACLRSPLRSLRSNDYPGTAAQDSRL